MFVINDTETTKETVGVLIVSRTEGIVPDAHDQSVFSEDCSNVLAFLGKPCPCGGTSFTLVVHNDYDGLDLYGMAAYLKKNKPELFLGFLLAMLNNVDEDTLDAALDMTGWNPPDLPDVAIAVDGEWVSEQLTDELTEKLYDDLRVELGVYLNANGHKISYAVIVIAASDGCGCNAVIELNGEEDDDPYCVVIADDVPLDEEVSMALESGIEDVVIVPVLERYGLVKTAVEYEVNGNGTEVVAEAGGSAESAEDNAGDGTVADVGGSGNTGKIEE